MKYLRDWCWALCYLSNIQFLLEHYVEDNVLHISCLRMTHNYNVTVKADNVTAQGTAHLEIEACITDIRWRYTD